MKFSLDLKNFDIKNDRQLQLALGASALIFLVISILFASNLGYAEPGIGYYYAACCFGIILIFLGLRSMSFLLLLPAILIILSAITISMLKFDWRKEYIQKAEAGEPFIFEQYVDGYPTLEEYLHTNFFGGENWIAFARACGEPARDGQPVAETCKSGSAIMMEYGINVQKEINDTYNKMRRTADMIVEGRLKNKRQYEACVARGSCAIVPLLPPEVDAEEIDEESTEYVDIRRAFWALVEGEELTEQICDQMMLCKMVKDMGALNSNIFAEEAASKEENKTSPDEAQDTEAEESDTETQTPF